MIKANVKPIAAHEQTSGSGYQDLKGRRITEMTFHERKVEVTEGIFVTYFASSFTLNMLHAHHVEMPLTFKL